MGSDYDLIGGNPAPGDPGLIESIARQIDATATIAQQARITLDGIGGELAGSPWEGLTADKFREAFAALGPDLGLMAGSYDAVSNALNTYAGQLEQIQQSVNQAMLRAQVAKQRKDIATVRLNDASRRISDLVRQLQYLDADVQFKEVESLSPAALVDPGLAHAQQQALQQTLDTRYAVQMNLYSSEVDQRAAQSDATSAATDLSNLLGWVGNLRSEHDDDERRAAIAIRDSLVNDLRNKSNLQALSAAVRKDLDKAINDVENINWKEVVGKIHDVLEVLHTIVADVSFVAWILAAIPGPWQPFVAALALALSIDALILSVGILATGIYMEKEGVLDPATGKPITGADLVGETVDTAIDAIAVVGPIGDLVRGDVGAVGIFADLHDINELAEGTVTAGSIFRATAAALSIGTNLSTGLDMATTAGVAVYHLADTEYQSVQGLAFTVVNQGKEACEHAITLFQRGLYTPSVGACYAS